MALLAALHKGAALLAALQEDLGHAFRKGKPFPASGPSAPAGRGRRAEKAACDFADACDGDREYIRLWHVTRVPQSFLSTVTEGIETFK